MQTMNALLGQLGQQLGIEGLKADEQGYCALSIDQVWVLHLAHVETRSCIQCMAELAPLPHDGRPALLAELLQANALLAGTDGSTLGLDAERDWVVLSRELPLAGLDFVSFEHTLELFVRQAERWMAYLHRAGGGAPDAKTVADTASAAPMAGWLRG